MVVSITREFVRVIRHVLHSSCERAHIPLKGFCLIPWNGARVSNKSRSLLLARDVPDFQPESNLGPYASLLVPFSATGVGGTE